MKIKITILAIFVSMLSFGQDGNAIHRDESIFKSFPELVLLDSISIIDIAGCYRFNFDGFFAAVSPCWYSTPIFAPFPAVVVSIDQQRTVFKHFN
jgi:hypothetical protein